MKNLFYCLALLLSFSALSGIDQLFQYPEDRNYTSADRGMGPYRTVSLYKSGKFSLTFDDGPHPTQTAQLLDILKKHNAKVTFFVLTSQINDGNAHLIKRMLDEGHVVGSHGRDHTNSNELSKDEWKKRVTQSFSDLAHWYKKAGYTLSKFYYRFPYGAYGTRTDYHHINVLRELSQELLGDNCIHMVFWDVDTADWVPGMTPAEVAGNIRANYEGGTAIDFKLVNGKYVKVPYTIKDAIGGGVVLQHDIQLPSLKAADLFLTYAKQRGIDVVPLEEIEEFKITKHCSLEGLLSKL